MILATANNRRDWKIHVLGWQGNLQETVVGGRSLKPALFFVGGKTHFEGCFDVLLELRCQLRHVEAALAVKVVEQSAGNLIIDLRRAINRHEVKADVVLLLNDAGEPEFIFPSSVDNERLLENQMVVTLVLHVPFTNGKLLGMPAEDFPELVEDGIKIATR